MKHEKPQFEYAAIIRHFEDAASGSSSFNIAAYLHHLDHVDMAEAEKLALVQALVPVVLNFVDLGLGTHPVQEACGKQVKSVACGAETDSNGMRPK
ncbi:hypothetical protein [Tranquillimonas rosea]|uniref:hypothetical protein n=1 Tax=Tranquillimonas rosea TaxID=641238 RepID=UPI0011602FBA|nr:hypothetical protein [Tranquillimonas rosea]